jgi:hypothetical protein
MLNRKEKAWLDADESGESFLLVGIGGLGSTAIGVMLSAQSNAIVQLKFSLSWLMCVELRSRNEIILGINDSIVIQSS